MRKKIIKIILLLMLTLYSVDVYAVEDTSISTSTDDTLNATSTDDVKNEETLSPTKEFVKLNIRKNSEIIFEGDIEISNSTTTIFDNQGTEHIIENNNVLSVINNADLESKYFNISDLQYYSSFDSFLINCVEIELESFCYNWQYVVNDNYPFVGIGDYLLEDGDVIYLYFGQPRKLSLPESATSTMEFSVDASEYNYVNNEWGILKDYTIGVFLDDPENPWTPIVLATSSVDVSGKTYFTIEDPGTYKIGLAEDYYYPFYELLVATSTVDNSTTTESETGNDSNNDSEEGNDSGNEEDPDSSSGSGSGGGSSSNSSQKFDIDLAINFLKNQQEEDGSFGAELYTDWAAIAFSSVDVSNNDLKKYVKDSKTDSGLYEMLRKSMALLALDLDPQEDYSINLIEKILEEFDGQQFGEVDFFNDDIFSLIVLQKVGFNQNDIIISETIDFILDNQGSSGAWEGVDLTSAAIQALKEFDNYQGVNKALESAEDYLRDRQNSDGGWSDVYSTSWAILAMNSLNYNSNDWQGDSLIYLGDEQDDDGGLLKDDTDNNRVWSTSYAITAASEKNWINILNSFSKKTNINYQDVDSDSSQENSEEESDTGSGGGSNLENDSESEEVSDSDNTDVSSNQEEIDVESLVSGLADFYLQNNDFASAGNVLGVSSSSDEEDDNVSLNENVDSETLKKSEDTEDVIEKKLKQEEINQSVAVVNSSGFDWWIYLLLGLIAASVSVIMFKQK